MKLHEIIAAFETGTTAVSTEIIFQYKKSLLTYYCGHDKDEPILMVTAVFNAASYAIVVPANEVSEAIDTYLNASDPDLNDEDKEAERETILFYSIPLSQL